MTMTTATETAKAALKHTFTLTVDVDPAHLVESQVAVAGTPLRWCHSCGSLFDGEEWVSPSPGHKVHDPEGHGPS